MTIRLAIALQRLLTVMGLPYARCNPASPALTTIDAVGTLRYGDNTFELGDRTLAHVEVVAATKLRRREAFFLTWQLGAHEGSARHCIWVAPHVQLAIHTHRPVPASKLNRRWLAEMAEAASSTHGLVLGEEPDDGQLPPVTGPEQKGAARTRRSPGKV